MNQYTKARLAWFEKIKGNKYIYNSNNEWYFVPLKYDESDDKILGFRFSLENEIIAGGEFYLLENDPSWKILEE